MGLPDVDQTSYDAYSAQRFTERNRERIGGLDFIARNQRRINGLGVEIPEGSLAPPQISPPQLPPIQVPQFPQIPAPQFPQAPVSPATPSPLAPPSVVTPPRPAVVTPAAGLPFEEPQSSPQPRVGGRPIGSPPPGPPPGPPGLPPGPPVLGGGPPDANAAPASRDQMSAYIGAAAAKRGIDPETAVAVANSEGLNTYVGDQGSSFGPFQLHYGNVAQGGNAVGGLGDTFTQQTGLDARDPTTWRAQVDFALDQAARGGWGPWHGAARIGVTPLQGLGGQPTGAPMHDPSPPVQTPGTRIANAPDQSGRIFPLTVRPDNAPSATYHSEGGSDLMAPRGTPVLSMVGGRVDEVFTDNGAHQVGGNAVLIHGDDGLDYYYAHFDQPPALKIGQRVGTGEQIGAVGNSGNAYKDGKGETHLHIGIGQGISSGVGAEGGLGQKFNAQALLTSLQSGIGQAADRVGSVVQDALAPPRPVVAETIDHLDQQRVAALSRLAAPRHTDPTLRQLDQAVETAYAPPLPQTPLQGDRLGQDRFQPAMAPRAEPQRPGVVAASGNPLDNLGSMIGNAIQSALQTALGGFGGPPGGVPPPGDRSRRDEDQRQAGLAPGQLLGEAGSALGESWRRFNEEPGYSPLNPIADAIGERIGEPIRQRVAPYAPLVQDLAKGVAPVLFGGDMPTYSGKAVKDLTPEELHQLVLDVGGAVGPPAGRTVAEALGVGREASAIGRAVEAPFRGAVSGLGGLADRIGAAGADSVGRGLSRSMPQQAWDNLVRLFTDSGTDLGNAEKELARRLKRPLTDSERVALLARIDPTHQAGEAVQSALARPLRNIDGDAHPDFYRLTELETDRSVAEGLARQTERDYLRGGIAPSTEERLAGALDDWTAAQNALDEAKAAATNPRTRTAISINAAQRRVTDAQAQLEAAAEVARQVRSDAAREQVERAPGAQLVTHAEQRALIIAENDAKRLNERYDRLYGTNPDNPYLETLGRQVGRAEDRVSRLRAQMGESSGARGEVIANRADAAADTAFMQQPRSSPTPQYASADVRLRYERQNLERLQSAQARGQRGLADDVARAEKRVAKAQADVTQAHTDLPAAARAQGQAQLHGREFTGPNGETIHYDDIIKEIEDLRAKYADRPQTWQQMQDGLQAVRDFRHQMLQEKVDHGLIDQQTMDDLLKAYDFWTPTNLTEFMSEQRAGMGLRRGSKFNVSDAGFRNYTPEGTSGKHENHMAALIREAYSHKSGVQRNDVNAALIRGFGEDNTTMRKIADTVGEYVDAGGRDGTKLHPDYEPRAGEEKITAMIDGKRQDYVTSNKLLVEALKQVDSHDNSPLLNLLAKPASLVRETAVQRNPAFIPVNLTRDSIAYAIRNIAEEGLTPRNVASGALNLGPAAITAATTDPEDPHRGQKISAALAGGFGTRMALGRSLHLGPSAMREFLAAVPDVFSGLGSGLITGEGSRELMRTGGGMRGGGFFSGGGKRGPLAAEEELRKLTRQNVFTVRNAGDLKQLLNDGAMGWVKALGERTELLPRVATQNMARARGSTRLEGMIKARDVTTDFNRGGRFSRELNRYVPFFNVGTQAPAQLGRLIHDHPAGALVAGLTLLSGPAAASEAWNNADPQRAKDYADVPQYLKNMGVVLMLPGEAPVDAQGNRVPQKIFIPVPNEFVPFVIAGREGYKRASGQGVPQSGGEIAGSLAQSLNPLGSGGAAEGAIYGMIPPPFGTYSQIAANRDVFRGSPIVSQYADDNASNFGKAVAPMLTDVISNIPGHEMDQAHPSQVDFGVRDLFSGLGTLGLNASDALTGRAARTPGAASETPLIGSMASRFVRGQGGQELEDARTRVITPSAFRLLRDAEVEWTPQPVPNHIGEVRLRREEQARYQALSNRLIDDAIHHAAASPSWASYSPAARERLLGRYVQRARQIAARRILETIPLESRNARRASGSSKE